MKRGQGEQFNWIFILVAGSVILGFFTMFAFRYINLQENKEDVRNIINLGGLLNTLEKLQVGDKGYSIDSNNPGEGLRFGRDIDINYECLGDKSSLFIGSGEFANYELQDEILFIKSQKTNALDAWIVPWRFPFHVTNLIYLASPKNKFYAVYDSGSEEYVNNIEFGDSFDFNTVNLRNLDVQDNSKYVFFTSRIPDGNEIENYKENFPSSDFVFVDLKNNQMFFYDNDWQGPVQYYGDELMLGAFFSDSLDSYSCNIDKAMKKLKGVSQIYIGKASILSSLNNKECNYAMLSNQLSNFVDGKYENVGKISELNRKGGCLWVF